MAKPAAIMTATPSALRARSVGGAAGEHGDLGHGQAAEAVDDPVAEVGGEADAGGAGGEGDLHDEDAGEQELDVVLAEDGLDEVAEHGGEAEHEQHGLHRGEEQRLRACARGASSRGR